MQIVEHSIVGTRSAVLNLRLRGARLRILLFPMFHVASPGFYSAVTERLRQCDLLVVEGVSGRSPLVRAITLTYRIIPANRRSGLVVDNIGYRSLGVPIINSDVTATEFRQTWRAIPLRHRLTAWCLIPFVIVAQFFRGRRFLLSAGIELNDLPSPAEEDASADPFSEHFDRAFGGDRDERVLATLSGLIRTRSAEPITVAVVYGAQHIPTFVAELHARQGYRATSAEWITVLSM